MLESCFVHSKMQDNEGLTRGERPITTKRLVQGRYHKIPRISDRRRPNQHWIKSKARSRTFKHEFIHPQVFSTAMRIASSQRSPWRPEDPGFIGRLSIASSLYITSPCDRFRDLILSILTHITLTLILCNFVYILHLVRSLGALSL